MSDVEISSGVWWDLKTEKVVESAPEEGIQLIAPGSVVTPAHRAAVDRYREIERPSSDDDAQPVETATDDGSENAVSTDSVKRKAK